MAPVDDERYKRVAALLGVECRTQHQQDEDWDVNHQKNFCTKAGCFRRLCVHCAGRVREQTGPWRMWCKEHG